MPDNEKPAQAPVKTRQLKKTLLLALVKNMGNISAACKAVKIHRSSFYDHYNKDLKFRADVDAIGEIAIDTVEEHLFKKIRKGDTACIIFYLKTKGKKRGYIERQELDINDLKIRVIRK